MQAQISDGSFLEPNAAPPGFGVRQSSGAFESGARAQKRQRTAAVQDASAPAAAWSRFMVPMRDHQTKEAFHGPTHPRPLPGGEQAFVRVLFVPLLGGVRGGFMVPLHAQSDRRHSMLPLPVGFAQRLQASGCSRKSRGTSVWRRRRDHRSAELQLRAKSIEPHPCRAGALRSALRKIVGVCVGFYGFCWIESLRQGVPLAAQRRGCAESDGSAPSSTWAVVRPTTLWCSGVGCGW